MNTITAITAITEEASQKEGPISLIEWLCPEALAYCASLDDAAPAGQELWKLADNEVEQYQTGDGLARIIERELDQLTANLGQTIGPERLEEAAPGLQRPGTGPVHPEAPHHPTSETLLHRLLDQHAPLRPGNGWIPEEEALKTAPDIAERVRRTARSFRPGQHLEEGMDEELWRLAGQLLDRLEADGETAGETARKETADP